MNFIEWLGGYDVAPVKTSRVCAQGTARFAEGMVSKLALSDHLSESCGNHL